MPQPTKILVGKIEKITDKETKEIVFVHKVYIEYPLDKKLRYVKTYCSLRLVRDSAAFNRHIHALIEIDAENVKNTPPEQQL